MDGFQHNLIVSRGGVRADNPIGESVIFANGDVTAWAIYNSVIVCDGDVTVTDGSVAISLIVARGNITIKAGVECSDLHAGGKITIVKPFEISDNHYNILEEKKTNPLGFVTFFELHRVGLKVKVTEGVITLTEVAAKSETEKAGLKVGDVILEANGKKPTDAEALRRLLRDALAVGDAAVKVKRGNDTVTVKVALPE